MSQIKIVTYTTIFTLKDQDPAKNRYIDMFFVWWSKLLGKGKPYSICAMIDTRTYDYIKNISLFQYLLERPLLSVHFILYPPPDTVKEGILHRYRVEKLYEIYGENNLFLYMDVDVLAINEIPPLFNSLPLMFDTIYVAGEKNPTDKQQVILDDYYFGPLATVEDIQWLLANYKEGYGVSAGVFAFIHGPKMKKFFEFILDKASKDTRVFKMIEQPYFNAAYYHFTLRNKVIRCLFFNPDHIKTNYHSNIGGKTILINFCGEPGDPEPHWQKFLTELIIQMLSHPSLVQDQKNDNQK